MASSVNNTVGLGVRTPDAYNTDRGLASGITKKTLSSGASSSVSESIARANYQSLTLSNSKLIELRKYVYKMVSMWSMEDKTNIITQYGDGALLKTHAKEDDINKQCTETLIINMRQQDLEILLKDIKVDEREIKKDVQEIRNKKKRTKSSISTGMFTTSSFGDVYDKIKDTESPHNIKKYLMAYDAGFKVPKNVTRQYGKLKKELTIVLKDIYDQVEVAGLAYNMDIDIRTGASFKEISNQIINKVLLYVSLIMGKSDTMYASGIVRGVKQYNELLKYTSYAFITGESGLGNQDLKELRKNAKLAKTRQNEGFKVKKVRRPEFFSEKLKNNTVGLASRGMWNLGSKGIGGTANQLFGLLGGVSSMLQTYGQKGSFKAGRKLNLSGGKMANSMLGGVLAPERLKEYRRTREAQKEAKRLVASGNNPLATTDSFELQELAKDAGLRTNKGIFRKKAISDNELRERLLTKTEEAKSRVEFLEIKRDKATKKGNHNLAAKFQSQIDAAKETTKAFDKKTAAALGDKIPYTYIDGEAGKNDLVKVIKSTDPIVPVYVANQINNIGIKLSSALSIDAFEGTFDYALPVYVINQIDSGGNSSSKDSGTIDVKGANKFGMDIFRKSDAAAYKYDKPSGIFKGLTGKDPFVANIDKPLQALNVKGAMGIRVFDQSAIIMAQEAERIEKRKNSRLKNAKSKAYLSEEATAFGIKMVRKEPAAPVYVVNAMQAVATREDVEGSKIEELAKKAASAALKTQFGPLIGGAMSKTFLGLASGGSGKALPKFAKGTNSSSNGTQLSQFIAGDSLNGKPNEEQVSIDWDRKAFQVKPVPSMSKSDLASGGISSAQTMGAAAKSAPMSVGIASHTVGYTRDLMYVKDQGIKQAIKVIAVNPGIYDKVDYEGTTLSLMDVIAEMSVKISSLEAAVQTGNSQRNAVIANTGATLQNIAKLGSSGSSSPFQGGFPSGLDSLLQGQ